MAPDGPRSYEGDIYVVQSLAQCLRNITGVQSWLPDGLLSTYIEEREILQERFIDLVTKFYQQVRTGCGHQQCPTKTCRSYLERRAQELPYPTPYRPPSQTTAKSIAGLLAAEKDARSKLCPYIEVNSAGFGMLAMKHSLEEIQLDPKSISQQLFSKDVFKKTVRIQGKKLRVPAGAIRIDTVETRELDLVGFDYDHAVREFEQFFMQQRGLHAAMFESLNAMLRQCTAERRRACTSEWEGNDHKLRDLRRAARSDVEAGNLAWVVLAFLAAAVSGHRPYVMHGDWIHQEPLSCQVSGCEPALICMTNVISLFHRRCPPGHESHDVCTQQLDLLSHQQSSDVHRSKVEVITIAKLAFVRNWSRKLLVNRDSDTMDALHFLDWLYLTYSNEAANSYCKRPIGQINIDQTSREDMRAYQTHIMHLSEAAEVVNVLTDPIDWLYLRRNEQVQHLFEYPMLFKLSDRITYFRSIQYHLMLKAFETSIEASTMELRMRHLVNGAASQPQRNKQILERLEASLTTFLVVRIRRDHILEDALNQLWRREARELRKPLKVKIGAETGEEAVDLGGVSLEFFRLAFAELLNPDFGLFTIDPATYMAYPKSGSAAPLYQFSLSGLLFGLAVYNGIMLPITFPEAFYAKLGAGNGRHSLETIHDGWPDLHKGFNALLKWEGEDVEDIFSLSFVFPLDLHGERSEIDMSKHAHRLNVADAIRADKSDEEAGVVSEPKPVTNDNRESYVASYKDWLINRAIAPQWSAFYKGFASVINTKSLRLFEPHELKLLVEGTQSIDSKELKRTARYMDGYDADYEVIEWFWDVVTGFNQGELKQLLEFVTSSERVPAAGLRELPFIIQKNGSDDERLPTSTTCFGRLLLPEYSSKEILEKRLRVAIENCEAFGLQ